METSIADGGQCIVSLCGLGAKMIEFTQIGLLTRAIGGGVDVGLVAIPPFEQ